MLAAGCRGADAPPPTPAAERVVRYAPADVVFPPSLDSDAGLWSRSQIARDGEAMGATYAALGTLPMSVTIGVAPLVPGGDAAGAFERDKVAFGLSSPAPAPSAGDPGSRCTASMRQSRG